MHELGLDYRICKSYVHRMAFQLALTVCASCRNRDQHGAVKKLQVSVYTLRIGATGNSVKASELYLGNERTLNRIISSDLYLKSLL